MIYEGFLSNLPKTVSKCPKFGGRDAAVYNALAEVLPMAKLLRSKIDMEVDF
jgi:hypothetical protein